MKKKEDSNVLEGSILLKDLVELLKNKTKYKLNQEKGHIGIADDNYDGEQGEYNEEFVYYRHPALPENVFMRETYHTDSYGNGENLVDVDFVQGKSKTITVYEPI